MIIEGHFVDAVKDYGICKIEVDNGVIANVGKCINKNFDLSFGKGIVLVPGIVDLHTHLRYGEPWKEDISHATKAAINGGVVRMMDMPNNPRGFAPVDSNYYLKKLEWTKEGLIPVHLWAGVGPDTHPFPEAKYYKVFMAESVGDLFFDDFETLDEKLAEYKGCKVAFHCEDPGVIREHWNEPTHERQRPPVAELAAVRNAVKLIRKYDLEGMIMHVSCSTSFAHINAHLHSGNVLAEVTPHHMLFNVENKNEMLHGELLKMNPPLRSEFDSKYLIEAITSGQVHHVGSDHAAHTIEEKEGTEYSDMNPRKIKNPSGIPGLDHMGQVLGYLHMDYQIPLTTLNKLFSYNPAQYLGIKHGMFEPNYEASIIGIDISSVHAVRAENVQTKARWSAYEGMLLPRVNFVMAQGRILKENYQLTPDLYKTG
jgi:dihydroorotase